MPDAKDPEHKLSEVIGGLVASVAHARSVADAEALRIALRYRQHELLRGLPVPRLRVRRVTISLPVALTAVIPGQSASINTPAEIARETCDTFKKQIAAAQAYLEQLGLIQNSTQEEQTQIRHYKAVLSTAVAAKGAPGEFFAPAVFEATVRSLLELTLKELELAESGGGMADSVVRDAVGQVVERAFGDVLQETTFRWVKQLVHDREQQRLAAPPVAGDPSTQAEVFDPDRARQAADDIMQREITKKFIIALRHTAQVSAILSPTIPPDFTVAVDTDKIKNTGGGPDVVTRLNLVLHEEGLEWTNETRNDGTESTKLALE